MGVVSQKLRQSAKGQYCTMQCIGICLGGTETTVLAHLPSPVKGMGTKSDDFCAILACQACHDALDQRRLSIKDELYYTLRAYQRTIKFWRDNDYITIAGDNEKPRKPSSKTLPRRPMTVQP